MFMITREIVLFGNGLCGDMPHATPYGMRISQLICFTRACSHISDFKVNRYTWYFLRPFVTMGIMFVTSCLLSCTASPF